MTINSTSQTSASVAVAQPSDTPAGGWSKYEVTACRDLGQEATCPIKKQECTFAAAGSTCTLDGLNSNTNYQVSVRSRPGPPGTMQSSSCHCCRVRTGTHASAAHAPARLQVLAIQAATQGKNATVSQASATLQVLTKAYK